MGAQKRTAPPAVRRILESGTAEQVARMKWNAAEARRRQAEEAKEARTKERIFLEDAEDEYRLKREAAEAARLRETNEDILPIDPQD